MRTKLKLFLWVLALSVFFVACDKSNDREATPIIDDALTEESLNDTIEMGKVSLTTFVKDIIQVKTGKPPTLEEVLNDLWVNFYSNNTAFAGALYNDLPDPMELPPGNYEFMMFTTNNSIYGADGSFVVFAGTNTSVNAVLGLMDVAVTLSFSEDIVLNYPDISAEATISNYVDGYIPANNILFWDAGIIGTGYFRMDEYEPSLETFIKHTRSADLMIEVIALHPETSEEIRVSKTYLGVAANQHYSIAVDYSTSGSTTTTFNFTLTDEDLINDVITFPN